MSEETKKSKSDYIIDEDEQEIENEEMDEESKEDEEDEPDSKSFKEKYRKEKQERMKIKEKEKEELEKTRKKITDAVLSLLNKGTVPSKRILTDLIVNNKMVDEKDYIYRYNFVENLVKPEIPELGGVLKKLRFQNKIKFSMENGSHFYFIDRDAKPLKAKLKEINFNWKNFDIPNGPNELYLIFKVPCNVNGEHFLASCFPYSDFDGFKIRVNKKYEKEKSFEVELKSKDCAKGVFIDDKLIMSCCLSEDQIDKSLFTIIQMGRKVLEEAIKLDWKYTEILKINDTNWFTPCIPIFRAKEKGAFYKTKYKNVFRNIFDFPRVFEKKNVFGDFSALSKEDDDDDFNIESFYPFVDKCFVYEVKSYISSAITKNWILNPRKALNYIKEDEELRDLMKEYFEDINTEKLMQEKIEEKMERENFIKETASSLLLTMLGIAVVSDNAVFRWIIIISIIVINGLYFVYRRNRFKNKKF